MRAIFFSFTLPGLTVPLFKVCTGANDRSPPSRGFVSCKQVDATSLSVSWGGFLDKESGIDHNEVSVGSAPGRDDIFAEILLQAISSVAHSRRDSAFDILLGFSKGFAEIGTLDGETH